MLYHPATTAGPWTDTAVQHVFERVLLTYPEGTAKLIRLAPSAAYPRHYHPDRTEYVYVLTGTARVDVGEASYAAHVGDFVLIPAGTPHALANVSGDDAILFVGALNHDREPVGCD